MKITSGPNWQFYAVTAFFVWISVSSSDWKPIAGWVAFCVLLIPICFWLHKWNRRENEQMLKDFPDDPYIQAKYGNKSRVESSRTTQVG